MECEKLEFKRVKCSDMQTVLDMPCQKIQWIGSSTHLSAPKGSPHHEIWTKAYNILHCARTEGGHFIVVSNWKKKVQYHWFRFYPCVEWARKDIPELCTKSDTANPRCYYLKKIPFNAYKGGIAAGKYSLYFLLYQEKVRDDGLPDVPHADLIDKLSPEAREKLYTPEDLEMIKHYEFGNWYYDMEDKLCKQRYENIGRSVLIKETNTPGTLQDIVWPGKITSNVDIWWKQKPATRQKAIAAVGKYFTYMIQPIYGATQIISRKEFIYTD